MKAKFQWILMACLLIAVTTSAQKKIVIDENQPCSIFLTDYCSFREQLANFEFNSQSKTALCQRGEKYSMHVVCYKGMDYRFAFCANEELLEGKPLQVKIFEKRTMKLIYDNANTDFDNEFEFSCSNSISLLVEVSLPVTQPVPQQKFEYKGCVVALMQSRKTFKMGF
jgi:hypothetical protein